MEASGSFYHNTTFVMKIQVQNFELQVPVNGINNRLNGILQAVVMNLSWISQKHFLSAGRLFRGVSCLQLGGRSEFTGGFLDHPRAVVALVVVRVLITRPLTTPVRSSSFVHIRRHH